MIDLPPPAAPARYDLVKARHHGRRSDLSTKCRRRSLTAALVIVGAAWPACPRPCGRAAPVPLVSATPFARLLVGLGAGRHRRGAVRRRRGRGSTPPTPSPPAPAWSTRRSPLLAAKARPPSRLAALGAPFDRDADGGFAQSLEAAHSRPASPASRATRPAARSWQAVAAAALATPDIEVRKGAHVRGLLQDAAGRVRGALVETQAAAEPACSPPRRRSWPPAASAASTP